MVAIAGEIRASGRKCLPLKADLTCENDVKAMVSAAVGAFGRIDILFNNAGGGTGAGPADSTPVTSLARPDWEYTLAASLTSVFLCTKHVARVMIAGGRGGSIVNTASVAAHHGVAGCSAYAAAKLAVTSLTQTLALELAPHHIRVNAFSPGVTDTQYVRQRVALLAETSDGKDADSLLREWVRSVPLGRPAEPSEMASVAAFLASDDASYVTGQTLLVDGGLTIR
jgi:NAD(P)-dependent dehydrogenase (short-subunit alcohol dehydrogenase family)